MEMLIQTLRTSDPTLQAVAVTAGGLIGVFFTLTVFFLFILIAVKAGRKSTT